MKVKIPDFKEEKSLADFVISELDGSDYDSGLIEKLDRTQDNIVRLLGVLIDLLVESKTLDGEGVRDLLSTYKVFEIVKEE